MKYYLIVGEASGDLHASRLIAELQKQDSHAEFRFFGGDQMQQAAHGGLVKHYRELAYMGFVPVLLHLPKILGNMKTCKQDIVAWQPDVLILVDYPGFNLNIAKYIKAHTNIPIYYYISPKIWAWKEYRIRNIKRDIDKLFSILPFEVPFFEEKHNYKIHYVGNPTVEEVANFQLTTNRVQKESLLSLCRGAKEEDDSQRANDLQFSSDKPVIALLSGSRRQEIKDNLPMMLEAAKSFPDYQFVIAGAPGIEKSYYERYLTDDVQICYNRTYELLSHSVAALVTSGTATLETALFNVPQVVCYYTPVGKFIAWLRKKVLKVKYISLVNLIVNRELVTELVADTMTVSNIRKELSKILPGNENRQTMLDGYLDMRIELGTQAAASTTASIILKEIKFIYADTDADAEQRKRKR